MVSWRDFVRVEQRNDGTIVVEDLPVSKELWEYLVEWLGSVDREVGDVISNVANVVKHSFSMLATHRVDAFEPFGDYRLLEMRARQLKVEYESKRYKPRPQLIALYGPPGTGKTTWVRQIAKKYLMEDGVLKGLYLEVTPGSITSKYVGVPVQTLRALMRAVMTEKVMSIMLLDEADGVLVKPKRVSSGYEVELLQQVAEMKTLLGNLITRNYPTMVVITSNNPNLIVESDEALADRVSAWIHVPPPPPEVREKIIARILVSVFRDLYRLGDVLGEFTKYRALFRGTIKFWRVQPHITMRWVTPILPYDADFLVGLQTAFGLNPLEHRIAYSLRDAILAPMDANNPLTRLYARVLASAIELIRYSQEAEQGFEKSFLRTLASVKEGLVDAVRLHVAVYGDLVDALVKLRTALRIRDEEEAREAMRILRESVGIRLDGRRPRQVYEWLRGKYRTNMVRQLLMHPIHPTILIMFMLRSIGGQTKQVLNDTLSLTSLVTWGVRAALAPAFLAPPAHVASVARMVYSFLVRLDHYNQLVEHELRHGRLLAPLRAMYTEPDLERAWDKAVRQAELLPEDHQVPVKLALIALRELHPAIHAKTPEEKAEKIYKAVRDRYELKQRMWETAKMLRIEEEIDYVLGRMDGVYVWLEPEEKYHIYSSSLLMGSELFDELKANPFNIALQLGEIGTIVAGLRILSRELVQKTEEAANSSA